MRDETISAIIDAVNHGTDDFRIFHRSLLANVDIAQVWVPDTGEAQFSDYRIFLIYSEGECAAAVLDMVCDLHVFTREKFRRKGLMKTALQTVILPFLRQEGRETQNITCGTEDGRHLSLAVGFEVDEDGNGLLDLTKVEQVDFPPPDLPGFDENKMEELKFRIRSLAADLAMIGDEIEYSLGPDLNKHFRDQRFAVRSLATDLSDYWRGAMLFKTRP